MNKQAYFKMMFPQEMRKRAAEEEQDKEARKAKKKEQKQRSKSENQASKSNRRRKGKYHSQALGTLTAPAITGAGGGLLGALIGLIKSKRQGKQGFDSLADAIGGAATGAVIGGGGGLAAQAVGGALGGIVGPRTLAQQNKYDSSTGQTVGNYLVPGMAGWNGTRTLLTGMDEQPAVVRDLLLQRKLKDAGLA